LTLQSGISTRASGLSLHDYLGCVQRDKVIAYASGGYDLHARLARCGVTLAATAPGLCSADWRRSN